MKPYATRLATPRDADGVTHLLQISYPKLMGPAYDTAVLGPALALMTQAQPALLDSGTYYVAESESGLIVGCGGWTRGKPGDGLITEGVGHIRHFATHPVWTRRGIGATIYRLCDIGARNAGISRFECYASLNAEGFYSALGFERICQLEIGLTPRIGLPGIHMYRRI